MQLAILGRQPKISLAELESLFGAEAVSEVREDVALVDIDKPLPQKRLGGTIKSAKVLTRLEGTDLAGAFSYLQENIPDHLGYLPEGKLQLGVSVYGFKAQKNWLLKQTLTLKKIVKKAGRSVRIIENKSEALEAAQVLYNKLTGPLGWEFLLVKDGADVILAQTTGVQNIDDYSKRDFERPKRDAYIGMLPPKLAQIMINLTGVEQWTNILDPFCGTGVVLQEGYLMGFDVSGSDIDPRMVEYSKQNMKWLDGKYGVANGGEMDSAFEISEADATQARFKTISPEGFSAVVCETFLGKPLTSLPKPDKLHQIIAESDEIAEGFLKNIGPQLKTGTRLCLALPAWHLGKGNFRHLPVLDQIANLGYNRLDLKHATREDLIYHRTDQVVARELTILEKI